MRPQQHTLLSQIKDSLLQGVLLPVEWLVVAAVLKLLLRDV
jgi:hypothetical protein